MFPSKKLQATVYFNFLTISNVKPSQYQFSCNWFLPRFVLCTLYSSISVIKYIYLSAFYFWWLKFIFLWKWHGKKLEHVISLFWCMDFPLTEHSFRSYSVYSICYIFWYNSAEIVQSFKTQCFGDNFSTIIPKMFSYRLFPSFRFWP